MFQGLLFAPSSPFVPLRPLRPLRPLHPLRPGRPLHPLHPFVPFAPFAQFIPFSIFATCISFVFYAPFVPFKSFRMIGNSWVSRIPRNSITKSDMPSALVNCDLSTCFLQQKFKNEWNHVFVPFSTCSWFCSLAAIFAVFARAQIVEASIV